MTLPCMHVKRPRLTDFWRAPPGPAPTEGQLGPDSLVRTVFATVGWRDPLCKFTAGRESGPALICFTMPCKGNVAPHFFAEKTVRHYTFLG